MCVFVFIYKIIVDPMNAPNFRYLHFIFNSIFLRSMGAFLMVDFSNLDTIYLLWIN